MSDWKISISTDADMRMVYQVYRWNEWDIDPEIIYTTHDEESAIRTQKALNDGTMSVESVRRLGEVNSNAH